MHPLILNWATFRSSQSIKAGRQFGSAWFINFTKLFLSEGKSMAPGSTAAMLGVLFEWCATAEKTHSGLQPKMSQHESIASE
jgi:hypothetical protein